VKDRFSAQISRTVIKELVMGLQLELLEEGKFLGVMLR